MAGNSSLVDISSGVFRKERFYPRDGNVRDQVAGLGRCLNRRGSYGRMERALSLKSDDLLIL